MDGQGEGEAPDISAAAKESVARVKQLMAEEAKLWNDPEAQWGKTYDLGQHAETLVEHIEALIKALEEATRKAANAEFVNEIGLGLLEASRKDVSNVCLLMAPFVATTSRLYPPGELDYPPDLATVVAVDGSTLSVPGPTGREWQALTAFWKKMGWAERAET